MAFPVGERQVDVALTRLTAAFGKPHSETSGSAVRAEYLRALRGLTEAELSAAVDACIDNDRYFPRPAALRMKAYQIRADAPKPPPATQLIEGCQQCRTPDRMHQVPRRALSTPDETVWISRPLCDCQFRAQVRLWEDRYLVELEDPIVRAEWERRHAYQRAAS